jgi:hypothetical protein
VSRTGAALAYPLTGLHDSMCGFFAISRSRLLDLAQQTSGFKIVFETMVRADGTLRVREIPIAFRERVRGKSKMSFSIALRFFFPLDVRDVPAPHPRSATLRSACKADNQQLKNEPRKFSRIEVICSQSPHITRPQESSAPASRQTRLELSPKTTTITSFPGRVPLAIKHLPAASV